jgi:uncharacterized membrane protein
MLVGFPIALFVATFVSDLTFWQTGNAFWATASFWLLAAGLVMAALAALAGLVDFFGEPKIRVLNDAWWHAGGNVLAVLLQFGNWLLRYQSGDAAILPIGLLLSLVVVCILLFTGWKGWSLVYLHRVAISDERREGEVKSREAVASRR